MIEEAKVSTESKTEPPKISEQEKKKNEKMAGVIKELEQAFFTIKFYPVAAKEDAKEEAFNKIKELFLKEEETIRQLILYMIHENISQIADMKTMHNFEHFKKKFPNADQPQLRMQVYRAMFNFNYSLEGILELIKLLGELDGDDAAKLLTYHFTFLSSIDAESIHMFRSAVVESLGNSNSVYALRSLLSYARYSDNERLLQRIASSLVKWDAKVQDLKISKKEKEKMKESLEQVLITEFGDSHYA